MSDTESIFTKMMQIMAGRYDRTFTWDIKVKMMGKNHLDAAHLFIGIHFVMFVIYRVV